MYRCYLRGGRICQASPPTCPSWTGRMDDNNKRITIIVSIFYRRTIYGPLRIFKSPVAPFALLFRLSTECSFLLPRAKPSYTCIFVMFFPLRGPVVQQTTTQYNEECRVRFWGAGYQQVRKRGARSMPFVFRQKCRYFRYLCQKAVLLSR